ncbi:MAG TPA: ribosome-associated translation inhibitor RaiA [Burkholderiales bacterium]
MNLNIMGHHIEITPALRSYTETKMERVLRHSDNVIDVSVVLSVEKLRQRAEVVVRVPGKDICISGDEEDMYAAIDSMIDKLDRQLLKHKDRTYSHQHEAIKHRTVEQ